MASITQELIFIAYINALQHDIFHVNQDRLFGLHVYMYTIRAPEYSISVCRMSYVVCHVIF